MFTDSEMRALFGRIMDRMVEAQWLHSYTFTEGKGYHLNWIERGTLAAMQLKDWGERLRLLGADERPLLLFHLANGNLPHPDSNAATVNAVLRPLADAGLASHAVFRSGVGCELVWTASGVAFCDEFIGLVSELGLTIDEDELLILFQIAAGWAPGLDTPVKFY